MTRWHSWPAWRRIAGLTGDEMSSATIRGRELAAALVELVDALEASAPENEGFIVEPLLEAVDLVADAHPTAAPILNIKNIVYLHARDDVALLRKRLAGVTSRLDEAPSRMATEGALLIADGSTVLTHSLSASVRAVLGAALADGRRLQVVVSDAGPGWRGRDVAHGLAADGFDVEVLTADEAVGWIAGMDLALVGAEAIGPGRVINRVGTGRLAEAARDAEVPMYVVAATDKILAEELFRVSSELMRSDTMEQVPLSWFTAVITDEGILMPGVVARRATEQPVARELR
ncbi:MAG: hypothetical protein OEP52_12150 [Acidimicrobiia bacterium]|nr:hypothetical protein [Acidimicrobiia bacterium]